MLLVAGARAQDQHHGVMLELVEVLHELDAVPIGEPEVQDHDVHLLEHLSRLGERTGLSYHGEPRLEVQHVSEGLANRQMILDDHDTGRPQLLFEVHSNSSHFDRCLSESACRRPGRGLVSNNRARPAVKRTLVPSPSSLRTSRLPPSRMALSRIPLRPSPDMTDLGSKPLPSSVISASSS